MEERTMNSVLYKADTDYKKKPNIGWFLIYQSVVVHCWYLSQIEWADWGIEREAAAYNLVLNEDVAGFYFKTSWWQREEQYDSPWVRRFRHKRTTTTFNFHHNITLLQHNRQQLHGHSWLDTLKTPKVKGFRGKNKSFSSKN
jgi:hypothetical protein